VSPHRPGAVIVLAAGEGTRMRSTTPKVMHEIGGRSLLGHALVAASGLLPEHLVVVVRHERDRVAAHVARIAPGAVIADQDDVKGTGRAVLCGLDALPADPSGTVVVTYGDVPLLTGVLLKQLIEAHELAFAAVTVLTARVPDPTGYGRIIRDGAGAVQGIVEHRDATAEQRKITEINSGIYAFDAKVLADALSRIGTDNSQGEVYLTDVLAVARGDGRTVAAFTTDDVWQVEGVNDRVQLAAMGRELNRRVLGSWMRAGVTVVDPATTWVDAGVVLEPDAVLLPGTHLSGLCRVASGARIGPDTTLVDCEVGRGATVVRTHGDGAVIGAGTVVGPFSHLRPGTLVSDGGRVASFVETGSASDGAGPARTDTEGERA
jgi:bifunctional UDP-N-acetylglucosamine pyrophosphorylase/glucosamine-1-phosphate N-acetyltransferase